MLHFIAFINSFLERTKIYLNSNATCFLLGMLQLRLDSVWLKMMVYLHAAFSHRQWDEPKFTEWDILPGQGMYGVQYLLKKLKC